jgi:hypothetical protein
MARIEGLEARGLFLRFVYWLTRRKVGTVVEPVRVLAHHPTLLMGVGHMERAFEKSRHVDSTLKSLVQVRAAAMIGCPF